ncbi:hypothetical protein Tco_1317626 [Tanacetum coccineum]
MDYEVAPQVSLPADASPTALSLGYVADSDPSEEDPEKDHADGGDDDDDDKEEEEDEEEEEHLAPADSITLPAVDHVPSAAMIWSSAASLLPLHAPSSPLLLPATNHIEDVLEADVPPRKRLCLTAPTPTFEVRESSAAATARQPRLDVTPATDYNFIDNVDASPGCPMSREVGYGITDVWDDMVGDMEGITPTTLEELSQRVTYLATTLARNTHKMYVRFEDAQDDRALQRA